MSLFKSKKKIIVGKIRNDRTVQILIELRDKNKLSDKTNIEIEMSRIDTQKYIG